MVQGQTCVTDDNCTGPNQYCYISGQCVSCLDCGIFGRFPGNGCVKNKDHCGKCLDGKWAQATVDGSLSVCMPGNTHVPQSRDTTLDLFLPLSILIGLTTLILAYKSRNIVIKAYTKFVSGLHDRICQNRNSTVINTPTEYQPSAPRQEYQPVYSESVKYINENIQQGVPYNYPYYVRQANSDNETNRNVSIENDDEETMSSEWTPQSNDELNLPNNFHQALAISNNQPAQPPITANPPAPPPQPAATDQTECNEMENAPPVQDNVPPDPDDSDNQSTNINITNNFLIIGINAFNKQ